MLNDFGLNRAISRFVNQNLSRHTVRIEYEENIGSKRYNHDMELILYRVVCELVSNSLKHSKCKRITLRVEEKSGVVSIYYGDDGVGFDSDALAECGLGLSNISSRINSLNGTFDIHSDLGKGMTAMVKVKLNNIK